MSHRDASLAWEGDEDPKREPGQFLREIEAQIDKDGLVTDKQMISRFKVNLRYGFQADLWFADLDKKDKDTYEHLVTAFETQWPLTKQPKPSKAERVRTLKEWVLKPEELGEKVDGPGGSQVYAHVRWANGLAARARDAEDTGGFALGEVFNALPRPVKELIRREPRTTYKELADAVLALDIGDLRDSVQVYVRDEETARLARAPPSPTKAIREMLSTTRIQTPQHTYQPPVTPPVPTQTPARPATNPFANAGGRGNLFPQPPQQTVPPYRGPSPGGLGIGRGAGTGRPNTQPSNILRNRPIDERHADLISFALPQHSDTDDGHAQHRAQCAAWHAANPTIKPDERHPYPLTPGTAPVGSFECWGCGQKGHRQDAGQGICPGDRLPEPERDWRRIASYITREYNKARLERSHAVNHITANTLTYPEYHQAYFQPSSYPGEVEDVPGNGQGSSA